MSTLLIVLACVLATTLATPTCVPPQQQFYWKSPCDGQTFQNRITVTDVKASQLGQSVDARGGLDISIPLDLVAAIQDGYGVINKPLIDISVFEYSKGASGKCEFKQMPTLGILDNIDSCKIVDNCHLTGDPKTLSGKVNIKELAGPLYAGINVDTYYGLQYTFKDDKTPVLCIYSQDIVIKK